jgi:hypothetical protein
MANPRSLVIDYLVERVVGQKVGIAYMYFNERERGMTPLLTSIVGQLAGQLDDIPPEVKRIYYLNRSRCQSPGLDLLMQIAVSYSQSFDSVFIILDALDECSFRGDLFEMISNLSDIGLGVKVFATSRDDLHDVQQFFAAEPTITIRAQDSDIRNFVEERLRMERLPQDVKSAIIDTISMNAEGM